MRGKRTYYIIAGTILFILASVAAITFGTIRKAQATLEAEKQKIDRSKTIAVSTRTFNAAPVSGMRLIHGPSKVHDAVEFEGKIYAATSSGLMILKANGQLEQRFTSTDGLPDAELTSLAVLSGELWIGTKGNGLIRYSRNQWQHFLPDNLEYQNITSLLPTSQEELYIGTTSGIFRYNGRTFEPFYSAQLNKVRITRIAGEAHRMYIGTFNSGLFVFENGTLLHIDPSQGLLDPMITDLRANSTGCYLSTPRGLQFYGEKGLRNIAENIFVTSFEPVSDEIWAFSRDRGVILLKSNTSARLSRISTVTATFQELENDIFVKRIGSSITAFGKNRFWVLNSGRWQLWSSPSSILSDSNISSLLRLRNGEIWVGYFDHGIDVLTSDFILKAHLQDETLSFINHLSTDNDGNIYVSTANGLVILGANGVRRVYRERDGLLSDRVMQTVPLDSHGKRVAIATSQGFTLKEGEAMRSIFAFHGLVNNHIYTIAARGDQIYLGTLGGISRVRNLDVLESWTQVDSGLKRNWVNALLAMDRTLLVGTYGSGLQARTESGEWIQFEALPEDFEVNPNALYSDGNIIFCGTLDRGFYIYEPSKNKWKQFNSNLPSSNLTAFAALPNSILAGTDNGLLQISYDKLSTSADLR